MIKRKDYLYFIPLNCNSPFKAYFFYKKYLITIQTFTTQTVISIFLIENLSFNRFLKIKSHKCYTKRIVIKNIFTFSLLV